MVKVIKAIQSVLGIPKAYSEHMRELLPSTHTCVHTSITRTREFITGHIMNTTVFMVNTMIQRVMYEFKLMSNMVPMYSNS